MDEFLGMRSSGTRTAVLGGGLQGCCIALGLALRGLRVTLYDCNSALLSRAAVVNEGKIHLGYVYCGDPSLATARTMAEGALAFAPIVQRYLGMSTQFCRSTPFFYAVHRDSLISAEDIFAYLSASHVELRKAAVGREDSYFGIDLRAPPFPMPRAKWEAAFDPHFISAAFETPEIAINPLLLAAAVRSRVAAEPNITLMMQRTVMVVEDDGTRILVVSNGPEGDEREAYDHVVNALWDGRHRIDFGRGARPRKPWLYRFKYGVRFRPPIDAPLLPSLTIVNGPYGDIVKYNDGSVYLSWYPACMQGLSMEVTPPDWSPEPDAPDRERVIADSFSALAKIVPALREIDPNQLPDLVVRGGVIVAWGKTDIDDPESLLHRRYEIGVTSERGYHSVDPGKYTMAPYFAEICANRIAGN